MSLFSTICVSVTPFFTRAVGSIARVKALYSLTYVNIKAYSHTDIYITYVFVNELLIYNAENGSDNMQNQLHEYYADLYATLDDTSDKWVSNSLCPSLSLSLFFYPLLQRLPPPPPPINLSGMKFVGVSGISKCNNEKRSIIPHHRHMRAPPHWLRSLSLHLYHPTGFPSCFW